MIPFRIKATANYESRRKQSQSDPLKLIAQSIQLLADKVTEMSLSQNKIFQNLGQNSKQVKNQRFQQRFRKISIQIPKLPQKNNQNFEERKYLTEVWMGKLCHQVFSTTFYQYEQQKLDERKAKAYCTENILSSLIKMIKINNLEVQEISNIDSCLKDELLPYFLIKYPMSEDAEVNLEFENKIIQVDSSQSNENDLIFKSGIEFNYKQDGHYDRQIMKFINFIIELPNSRFEDQTLFKVFYSSMENLFKKVEDPEFTIAMNKFDIRDLENEDKQKQILDNYEAKSNNNFTIEEEKEREHYKEKVKGYTKKLIGRKISENIKPFSEIQIKEGELKLKNPAIMRIITKWCEELMLLFVTDRNILNKQEQFRMKDGKEKILKRKHLLLLAQLLKREKKKVDQYLEKVNRNNSSSQYDFGNRSLPKFMEKFSQEESQVGLFATSVIRNYQTYLVGYINTIIHSLMSAVKDYEEMVKAYQYKQQQYGEHIESWRKGQISFADLVNKAYYYRLSSVPASYYSLIPQLVSFRVGDLMRCRCISKQKQIIALYTELQRISSIKNSGLKIVKIKNRLQKGTKDILINILFKNKMLVEMQLGIATSRSKFVDFSNKFNHVLYELKRAQFGPISEMCNIWINNDVKSEFYIDKSIKINVRMTIPNKQSINRHVCSGDPIEFPFRCSQCQYFYNDCSYVLKHIQCSKEGCRKKVCSLCRAERFDYNELKKHFMIPERQVLGMIQGEKFLDYRKRTSTSKAKQFLEKEERSGMLIDLKGENKKPIYYRHVKIGKRSIIIEIVDVKSQNMRVIKQITTFQQMRIFKKQYLIFSSPKITEIYTSVNQKAFNRVLTQYNFPKYIKKWNQKEKSSIAFMDGGIQDRDISNIDLKFPFTHKICFYQNKITNLELLLSKFDKTEIVDVGHNYIKRVQFKISKGNPLNLKVLYLNYNSINFLDPKFIDCIQDLEELQLANNQLTALPGNFGKLSQLKIINISRNLFTRLPDVVTELKNLRVLNLYSAKNKLEKILQIPDSIANLKSLRKINLNFNALQRFPDSFGELQSLEILYATNNRLKSLPSSFRKLEKLKILNLASNQFDKLPDQIGSLVNIEIMNLQSCSKTEQPLKKLPQSYCNLVNIKMMDISQNKIVVLPDNISSLGKLQTLFLYENNLTAFPQSICDISTLRLLYASNNFLASLPKNIDKLQNLEKITLKENYTLAQLPENITKLKKLKHLIIKDNNLKSLPNSIGQLTSLRELIASNNNIKSLPKSIVKLKELQTIQVDINKLDDDSKVLLSTFVSIKNLKIDLL